MVNCPSCGTAVDQDFGMVTCGSCKAVFMINYAGDIAYGQQVHEESPSPSTGKSELSVVSNNPEIGNEDLAFAGDDEVAGEEFDQELSVHDIPDPLAESEDSALFDSQFDSSLDAEENSPFSDLDEDLIEYTHHEPDPVDEALDEGEDLSPGLLENLQVPEEEVATFDENFTETENSHDLLEESESIEESSYPETPDLSDTPPPMEDAEELQEQEYEEEFEEEHLPVAAMATEPDSSPVDITDFADSDESSLEDGEYLYDLRIERIDSKELKDAVYYTLADEKLGLVHDQLVRRIRNGILVIPDLHPLKAKKIVEQLQYCDIDILWEQRAVIMGDSDEIEDDEEHDMDADIGG